MWNKKDFMNQKQACIDYINKKGFSTGNVGEYCTLTGVPLIVMYEFIIDELPEYTKACRDKIKDLNKFYGIMGI